MITLLIRPICKAAVELPITHSIGRQTLPIGALELPSRAQGHRGDRSTELLIRLVSTVRVAVTTQSHVQTWSTEEVHNKFISRYKFVNNLYFIIPSPCFVINLLLILVKL